MPHLESVVVPITNELIYKFESYVSVYIYIYIIIYGEFIGFCEVLLDFVMWCVVNYYIYLLLNYFFIKLASIIYMRLNNIVSPNSFPHHMKAFRISPMVSTL